MRTLLGAAGLALMAVGGLLVWDQATHWDVLIWLAGAVVLHDGIIGPLVLTVGLLTGILMNRSLSNRSLMNRSLTGNGHTEDGHTEDGHTDNGLSNRGLLRGTLMTAGCLVLIALPVLLRPLPTANPSVLPLNYARGLTISLVVLAVLAVLLGVARRARRGRGGRGGEPSAPED
ncbi:hypothetical protein ABZX93_33120 [Streptomyces sp. NPDC006632]|uniref:hypothetical protein n=1 Tax=Streptomyces sp. NPDC006632 TaxID=3157182 RepID=UPI0033A7C43D